MAFGQNPYYFPNAGAVPGQLEAYKQPYQPMYQQPMMQPVQPQGNCMLWVQGEAAAKSWAVAPGATVVLWDSENPFIYIKSADASGVPSMRKIRWEDYRPEVEQSATDGVKELEKRIDAIEKRLEEMEKKEEQA
jgi:hypothetical protein